jgi:hypothetical protein
MVETTKVVNRHSNLKETAFSFQVVNYKNHKSYALTQSYLNRMQGRNDTFLCLMIISANILCIEVCEHFLATDHHIHTCSHDHPNLEVLALGVNRQNFQMKSDSDVIS